VVHFIEDPPLDSVRPTHVLNPKADRRLCGRGNASVRFNFNPAEAMYDGPAAVDGVYMLGRRLGDAAGGGRWSLSAQVSATRSRPKLR